jgi:hypothetical protein
MKVSIHWLAEVTGKHAATVKKRVEGLARDASGKLNSAEALEAIFIGTVQTEDGHVTTQEAVRQLTVEKALQVRLQNEITRKERIPIDDVLEVTGRVFRSMAATIKSKHDKVLTLEVINELFAELRSFPDRLNWPAVKSVDLDQ